jgi:hypothetical protein
MFSRAVFSLYMDAYSQVNAIIRNKMLLTWQTADPEHSALFGHDIQERLQTAVWGNRVCCTRTKSSMGNNHRSAQNLATRSEVLAGLQFTLGQMECAPPKIEPPKAYQ